MLMSKSVRWKTIWSHYRKLKKYILKQIPQSIKMMNPLYCELTELGYSLS